MPQQINLHNPVLLAPRKHFAPVAMMQALTLWVLGLAALSGWSVWRTGALEAETATAARQQAAERRLEAVLATRDAAGDTAALEQQLADVTARLAARTQLLDSLARVPGDTSPIHLLRSFSHSIPPPVWLTEVRWTTGQLILAGQTLQPDALQAWLGTLGSTAGLQVTRLDDESGRWAFRFTGGSSEAER